MDQPCYSGEIALLMRQNSTRVFANIINGSFPVTPLQPVFLPFSSLADLDNDGAPDITCLGMPFPRIQMYRQNSTLMFYDIANLFTFPEGVPVGGYNAFGAVADVNGDGRLDIFLAAKTAGYPAFFYQSISTQFHSIVDTTHFLEGLPQVGFGGDIGRAHV